MATQTQILMKSLPLSELHRKQKVQKKFENRKKLKKKI